MNISIGAYDEQTRTVPVTFAEGDVNHRREVNACHDKKGAYDAAATKERVEQVGLGVAQKIKLGVIKPEAETVEDPATGA
jgi:hypothetical protein